MTEQKGKPDYPGTDPTPDNRDTHAAKYGKYPAANHATHGDQAQIDQAIEKFAQLNTF